MKRRSVVPLAVLLAFATAASAACGGDTESPTEVAGDAPSTGELVITQGAPAPVQAPRVKGPSLSAADAGASAGGSVSTALHLKSSSCEPNDQQITVTYTITGNQVGTATLTLNSVWTFNGSSWSGSSPTSVTVPPRTAQTPATIRQVTVTVVNASSTDAGTSSFTIVPTVSNSNSTGAKLDLSANSNVTIHVAFEACPVVNTAPTLVLPNDMTIEATSSAGATVNFTVTASDLEDGDLTAQVSCTPASGSTFALGTTTVNCSVTDAGGLSASGSFNVTVEDTTPAYFTSFPTGTISLIAADINGAVLDLDALGITVEDVGNVSEPSTFACDYVAGTVLEIGSTTTVSCTAKDAIGNESTASAFDVFVGLDVDATGFLPPLRMAAPFSAHKRGSTIPHKFLPPRYADGTPATDLAGDLRLAIKWLDGVPEALAIEVNDYAAGSTVWRYDPDAGHYIFNLKTVTSWAIGTWQTTVSYKGIPLATTKFDLKK